MGVSLIVSLLVLLPSILLVTSIQLDALQPSTPSVNPEEGIYIAFVSERPTQVQDPRAYYIKILSSVLGSENAAKKALIYSYKVIDGFAAKLTDEQASSLKEQPGILAVIRDVNYTVGDPING